MQNTEKFPRKNIDMQLFTNKSILLIRFMFQPSTLILCILRRSGVDAALCGNKLSHSSSNIQNSARLYLANDIIKISINTPKEII